MKKSCLWCGVGFEIKRHRAALCPSCRTEKKREYDRRYQAEREEARQVILARVLDQIPPELHAEARGRVEADLDRRDEEESIAPSLPMPAGSRSAAGPEEGRSTFSAHLRGELDTLSARAAADPWWGENPPEDVFFELGEIEDFSRYLADLAEERTWQGVSCGDAKGTRAGYDRHLRAGESPCDPCTKAKAEALKSWRLRSHK